jgi:ankyrin repeat protein
MLGSLVIIIIMTSFTHYMFTILPEESLNTSVDLNARDIKGGYTPLMLDAANGNLEHAKSIIALGADLNARSANRDRDNALNIALINVNNALETDSVFMIAKLLIEAGADIHLANARGEQPVHTLLRISDFDRRMDILDMLMLRWADINAQTLTGETMMHVSITLNSPEWIRRLAKAYGQLINLNIKNNDGYTPLQLAEKLGRVGAGTVGEILGAGDITKPEVSWPIYIGTDLDTRATDNQGRNGLMLSILRGDVPFAKKLIIEMQKEIISMATRLAEKDSLLGNTALHYAVLSSKPDVFVAMLLNAGSPVDARNNNGDTPLMLVPKIWKDELRLPVAQMLLSRNADLLLKNRQGKNAVTTFAESKDKKLIDLAQKKLAELQKFIRK